jgi:hypothetical protein
MCFTTRLSNPRLDRPPAGNRPPTVTKPNDAAQVILIVQSLGRDSGPLLRLARIRALGDHAFQDLLEVHSVEV